MGIETARAERRGETLALRLLITVGVLVGAFLLLVGLRWGRRMVAQAIEARRERFPSLRFRGLELVSAASLLRAAGRLVWLVYGGGCLVVLVAALLLVFDQFPATQGYARQILLWIWQPLVRIGYGILGYLPNLFYILVIVLVTRAFLRALGFLFEQAHRGVISLEPWIHRDVARPTSQIIKVVVIVVALFFIAPLIPGTGSTAAQGISVILGLMVSFGSTSTVGNIVAGVVLTYMRPFQIGERVKIGDTVGDVVQRAFLYTKVLTIKNEEVIVPSLQVLSSPITNFSARSRSEGLIVHTTVTIGYDAPWRKVHELLIGAAGRTPHLLKDPKPFVLQTSLDDFFVSYQLNAYTDRANEMQIIYSALHQHIQDAFNEGGVEIMSPHHYQLRDGNTTTIPATYREAGYQPARFLVEALAGERRGGSS
jgi:small-conductance mechanosensitive channel